MSDQTKTSIFKNIWSWVVVLFAGLAGALFYTRGRRQQAESQLRTADTDKASAIIDNDRKHLRKDRDDLEEKDRKLDDTPIDTTGRTDDDVVDYYKKK